MEERGYSDFLRNTSEDIVLKSFMENPIGTSSPSMEMLGFKNLSQILRGDSEELFSSWLMNGEIPGFGSGNVSHRNRQTSRRITTEPSAFSSQQNGVAVQKRSDNESFFHQYLIAPDDQLNNVGQHSLRNAAEKGMEAGNLYLAKAWFHSNQPMTRSRSSELRRRYAALQNSQTTVARSRLDISNTTNNYDISMTEMPNQLQTFMSPSNSSTCPFNAPPMANGDTISSVVSMLKGTLEQKKIGNQVDKDTSFGFFNSQEVPENMSSDQTAANQAIEPPRTFHTASSVQVQVPGNLASMERFVEHSIERCVIPSNQIQMSSMSREPSQSESSAVGFDGCDGPANSGQALSVSESSRKIMGNRTSDHGSKNLIDFRDRVFENNLKNDQKKGSLLRMGSFTSGGSVDKGDPTKKRRVERSRKNRMGTMSPKMMAEAKERNLTPPLPSDMQSVLKRSENLEKEVRSLKLNLSFMNRKDSEQTKQIEELQKQNDELMEEKERLLEEIERIITEPGRL